MLDNQNITVNLRLFYGQTTLVHRKGNLTEQYVWNPKTHQFTYVVQSVPPNLMDKSSYVVLVMQDQSNQYDVYTHSLPVELGITDH